MGTYETRSRTRQINSGNISEEKQYTSSRNRLLCRANELSQQHGCQVAVIVIKEDQVTQYSSCEMVDVLKRYSDMCTQPHLSLNQSDFEKSEDSRQKENKDWAYNIMSDTPSIEDLHQIGPMTVYSQPEFEVDDPHYQLQSTKEDSYQDVLRNFEWYAQEMHEEAEMLLSYNKGMGDTSPPRLPIDLPGNYSNFGEFDQQENLFDSMDTEIYSSTDFCSGAPIPQQFLDGLNFDKSASRPESSPSNTTNDGQFSLGGVQVQ